MRRETGGAPFVPMREGKSTNDSRVDGRETSRKVLRFGVDFASVVLMRKINLRVVRCRETAACLARGMGLMGVECRSVFSPGACQGVTMSLSNNKKTDRIPKIPTPKAMMKKSRKGKSGRQTGTGRAWGRIDPGPNIPRPNHGKAKDAYSKTGLNDFFLTSWSPP